MGAGSNKAAVVELVAIASVAAASCAITAGMMAERVRSRMQWRRVGRLLEKLREECEMPVSRLRTIADAIAVEMHAGLATEGGSKIKMLTTYVDTPPQGTEKGYYYGIDFGGTNYRIVRIELGGQKSKKVTVEGEKYRIPEYLKESTCEDVFDFIAAELKRFVESKGEGSSTSGVNRMELGFSFSFPVKQRTISSGNLIKWTKGFAIQDGVNRDVAECLQQALDKIGLHMRVAALVNDTVGTLCYGQYQNQDTIAAVVIGTGTNACYLERASSIIKRPGLLTTSGEMIVNVEWGNFYSAHLPRTSYDADLDDDSPNPKEQGFEKMISGMYLGEIVRRVILRMLQESELAPVSERLSTPFTLSSLSVGDMNQDESLNLDEVARVFSNAFEIPQVPLKFRRVVVDVCDIVTGRAAGLVASGVVGILKKLHKDGGSQAPPKRTTVVIEGGVYTGYKLFREYLQKAVSYILGEETSQYIILSGVDCGPEVGAALLAASRSPISSVDTS